MNRIIGLLAAFGVIFLLGCQSETKKPGPFGTNVVTEAPPVKKEFIERSPTYLDEKNIDQIVKQLTEDAIHGTKVTLTNEFLARQLNIYLRAEYEVERFEKNLKELSKQLESDPNVETNPLEHDSYEKLMLYWKVSDDQLQKISRVYDRLLSQQTDPRESEQRRGAAKSILENLYQWLEKRSDPEKAQLIEVIDEMKEIDSVHMKTSTTLDGSQKRNYASTADFDYKGFSFLKKKNLTAFFKKHRSALTRLAAKANSEPNPWVDGVTANKIEFTENRKPSSNKPAIPDAGPDGNFFGLGCPPGTFAFTFDDGPKKESTERLIEYMKNYSDKVNPKLPATFFVLLRQARLYKSTIQMEVDQGYGVHDHSFSHPDLNAVSHDVRVNEVLDTVPELKEMTGIDFKFFRCPYGSCVAPKIPEVRQMIADSGLIHAHWTIDSLDWKNIGQPDRTYDLIVQQMKLVKRGTILMHDIHESSVDAAIQVLNYIKKQNDSGAQKIRLVSLEQAVEEYNAAAKAAEKK